MLGRQGLEALAEPTYRLYNCERCGVQVRICARCDHGQIYCAGECARVRRRESLRRAGMRYQRSRRGAHRHAVRQRRWRECHRQKVTHQGCCRGELYGSVSARSLSVMEPSDADRTEAPRTCAFCRSPLPPWTRLARWYWSG